LSWVIIWSRFPEKHQPCSPWEPDGAAVRNRRFRRPGNSRTQGHAGQHVRGTSTAQRRWGGGESGIDTQTTDPLRPIAIAWLKSRLNSVKICWPLWRRLWKFLFFGEKNFRQRIIFAGEKTFSPSSPKVVSPSSFSRSLAELLRFWKTRTVWFSALSGAEHLTLLVGKEAVSCCPDPSFWFA